MVIAIASSSAAAQPAAPDCMAIFAPTAVAQAASDSKYKHCDGALEGYWMHVSRQRDLSLRLRVAYERELVAKEDNPSDRNAKKQIKAKLAELDQALARLTAAGAPPTFDPPASAPAGSAGKAAVRQWLTPIKQDSQRISDRINSIGGALKEGELVTFCEQDKYSRIRGELEKKLASCLLP